VRGTGESLCNAHSVVCARLAAKCSNLIMKASVIFLIWVGPGGRRPPVSSGNFVVELCGDWSLESGVGGGTGTLPVHLLQLLFRTALHLHGTVPYLYLLSSHQRSQTTFLTIRKISTAV
jgi:hypothetical protein